MNENKKIDKEVEDMMKDDKMKEELGILDDLDKSTLTKMKFDLRNIVLLLNSIFHLKNWNFNNKAVILALGNTGCGKSTMFTSLAFGIDSLEVKKIK